jgi:hypothetical protein
MIPVGPGLSNVAKLLSCKTVPRQDNTVGNGLVRGFDIQTEARTGRFSLRRDLDLSARGGVETT